MSLVFVRMSSGEVQFHLIVYSIWAFGEWKVASSVLDGGERPREKLRVGKKKGERHEGVKERKKPLNRPFSPTSFKKWMPSGSVVIIGSSACVYSWLIKNKIWMLVSGFALPCSSAALAFILRSLFSGFLTQSRVKNSRNSRT